MSIRNYSPKDLPCLTTEQEYADIANGLLASDLSDQIRFWMEFVGPPTLEEFERVQAVYANPFPGIGAEQAEKDRWFENEMQLLFGKNA